MRAFHNLAVSACLLSLVAVNLASNPFLLQVWAQSETSCEDPPAQPRRWMLRGVRLLDLRMHVRSGLRSRQPTTPQSPSQTWLYSLSVYSQGDSVMCHDNRKQELFCGFFDALRMSLVLAFVLFNTRFLPIPGSQAESYAVFGACPQSPCKKCKLTFPGWGVTDCKVGGWIGTCTGWCGWCDNGSATTEN